MKKITIFVYGATKENPGPAAIAVRAIAEDESVIFEVAESIGNANGSYANWYVVMRALQLLEETFGEKSRDNEYEIRISEELIVQQLNNQAQINEASLVPLFIEIHNMRVSSFPNLTAKHCSRESNKESEKLVNEILSK